MFLEVFNDKKDPPNTATVFEMHLSTATLHTDFIKASGEHSTHSHKGLLDVHRDYCRHPL